MYPGLVAILILILILLLFTKVVVAFVVGMDRSAFSC
jgi:hypothetical protein